MGFARLDAKEDPFLRAIPRLTFVFAICALPSALGAQTPPAPPVTPPVVTAGPGGFVIQSADGDFRLQIGVLAQLDGRFAPDVDDFTDTFLVRRLRPYLRGRVARRFEFYINPDFAGSTLVLQDAYVDTVFSTAIRLRAGKAKAPFGLERLQSASNLLFMERAEPTSLVPDRDIGLQLLGDLAGDRVSYAVSLSNGVADGGSADEDNNDAKDVVGRVVVQPLAGLWVGLAGSIGREVGTPPVPSYRTSVLQRTFFTYTATLADGVRTRYSPQGSYYRGPFGGFAEYVHTEMPMVGPGNVRADIGAEAWQVAGSWVLTGEDATDAAVGLIPRAAFDPENGNWGAFQVAARYQALAVDQQAITLGFATPGASRTADSWTLGLNWYLTQNFRYTFNFERTVFDGDSNGPRPAENGLAFRTQIYF